MTGGTSEIERPGSAGAAASFARVVGRMNEAAGLLAAAAVLGMIGVLCTEVFARYVMGRPTSWANEVTSYLLVAATAFGAPYTLSVHGHVAIDVLVKIAPPGLRALSHRFSSLVVIVFSGVLCWFGLLEVMRAYRLGDISLTPLAMPTYLPFSLMPICAVLLALQGIAALTSPAPDAQPAAH